MPRTKRVAVEPGRIVAVLTGDLIGSSRVPARTRGQLYRIVDTVLSPRSLRKVVQGDAVLGSQVFRGDAFQLLLDRPHRSLAAALHIIADLRSKEKLLGVSVGARIAIGVGTTDFISTITSDTPAARTKRSRSRPPRAQIRGQLRGDGEAFRFSGRCLDQMRKPKRQIMVRTPWLEVDAEIDVGCRFLEGVMAVMSAVQAAALRGALESMPQREIADAEGRSQSAIAQRLRRVNWRAVRELLARFTILMDRYPAGLPGPGAR